MLAMDLDSVQHNGLGVSNEESSHVTSGHAEDSDSTVVDALAAEVLAISGGDKGTAHKVSQLVGGDVVEALQIVRAAPNTSKDVMKALGMALEKFRCALKRNVRLQH